MAGETATVAEGGPLPGVKYPLKMDYCGNCSMPLEYCEYYPDYDGCKRWLEKNMPERFASLEILSEQSAPNGEGGAGGQQDKDGPPDGEKKRQTRGGKGQMKVKKKEAEVEKHVILFTAPRGKKKAVTVVQGLKGCGIDLKVASKVFGQKFACGSSITGDDEIVIQGDVKDDLFDLIPERWPEVDEDFIEDQGTKKR